MRKLKRSIADEPREIGLAGALIVGLAGYLGCANADRLHLQADTSRLPPATAIQAEFVRVVGGRGSSAGEFVRPSGISVNALGQAYVVDTGNDRVQQFDPSGRYLSEIGGFGWSDGQFNRPSGITASGSLDIWVADTQNRRIVHLNAALYWLGTLTQEVQDGVARELGYPTDVAVSADGWLWFTDKDTDRLRRLSPFAQSAEISTGSAGVGDLNNPSGVAVGPDGSIVVADMDDDRIVLYDRFGNLLRSWGEGFLRRPGGVDVTWQGDIVIADTGNDRIVFLNRLCQPVGTYGASGAAPGAFRAPGDVAVDRHGRMGVADTENHRLQVFRLLRQAG